MKDKPLAKLLMDEAGATQRISKQINIGKELYCHRKLGPPPKPRL